MSWNELTVEQVQAGISGTKEEMERIGMETTAFVRNGFRMQMGDFFRLTSELTIQIPALPRPTLEELQAKFNWVKSIERDTSTTEATTLKLGTVLRTDETSINGKEYELRLAPKLNVLFGYQHATWLVENQDKSPELMVLLGKIYIDFPGLVVVGSYGSRSIPCLNDGDRRWEQNWHWVGNDLNQNGRVAASSK